jgi:hypothetical protein
MPRALQAALGLFNFLSNYVALGRLHLRPLQHWLRQRWVTDVETLDIDLTVTTSLRAHLLPWKNEEWLMEGLPLVTPSPTVLLFTDSSLSGWGAVMGDLEFQLPWTPQVAPNTSTCWNFRLCF